jgi:hypothetical protein
MEVMEEQCDQCLFDPKNRIVDEERMQELLDECREQDAHFACHKATIANRDVVCRGFYDNETSQLIRIMQRLAAIEFVPVPDVD